MSVAAPPPADSRTSASAAKGAAQLSLSEFRRRFPPEPQASAEGALEYLFYYDLDLSPEELWPTLSDTSAINRRLELPEMQFEEREGRLHGTAKMAGQRLAWIEVPWEWEYLHTIRAAREYSAGFAKYAVVRYYLQPLPADGGPARTRLYAYFLWVPANFFGRLLIRIGMGRLRSRYGAVVEALARERLANEAANREAQAGADQQVREARQAGPAPELNWSKLQQGAHRLRELGLPDELIRRVGDFISQPDDEPLYRIRVRALAREWGVNERELLTLFLHGCREGLFYLSWDVICPHCRGVRTEIRHLGELPKRGECDVCEIDFDAQGLNSFEVTFHVHSSVREVAKRFFCSAEPAKKSHIKLQLKLRPGESRLAKPPLESGTFRLRVQGNKSFRLLELKPGASAERVVWHSDDDSEDRREVAPPPELLLENGRREEQTFVLDELEEDRDRLLPADLFNLQEFRDIFSEEALAADAELDVGEQVILFTDVVGSSRFYDERGDHGAFLSVRRHFVVLYDLIQKNRGVVVKTIGDAVMAAFSAPADAVRAAIDIQRRYDGRPREEDEHPLRLRISIHSGPCLAVNLNSNIDYFGRTVNIAAKIQAAAEAGQLAVTQPVAEDLEVAELLHAGDFASQRLKYRQPWDGQLLPLTRYTISAGAATAGDIAAATPEV